MTIRASVALSFVVLISGFATAQTAEEKKAALAFIDGLRDPKTGAFAVEPAKKGDALKPSIRACNGAIKAMKALGGEVSDAAKVKDFVLGTLYAKTGAFAEPGDKPSVATTAVGVILAIELGIEKDKLKASMAYLKSNAKGFEDYRIAAAAIEAWGQDSDYDEAAFKTACNDFLSTSREANSQGDPRDLASVAVVGLRVPKLGLKKAIREDVLKAVLAGQRGDGGWGKAGAKGSDLETTYRVVRFLKMVGAPPKDAKELEAFLASCRNADGGSGVAPKQSSTMSGTYYAAIVQQWLRELARK